MGVCLILVSMVIKFVFGKISRKYRGNNNLHHVTLLHHSRSSPTRKVNNERMKNMVIWA